MIFFMRKKNTHRKPAALRKWIEEWVEGADIWVLSVAKRQGGRSGKNGIAASPFISTHFGDFLIFALCFVSKRTKK